MKKSWACQVNSKKKKKEEVTTPNAYDKMWRSQTDACVQLETSDVKIWYIHIYTSSSNLIFPCRLSTTLLFLGTRCSTDSSMCNGLSMESLWPASGQYGSGKTCRNAFPLSPESIPSNQLPCKDLCKFTASKMLLWHCTRGKKKKFKAHCKPLSSRCVQGHALAVTDRQIRSSFYLLTLF